LEILKQFLVNYLVKIQKVLTYYHLTLSFKCKLNTKIVDVPMDNTITNNNNIA